MGFNGFRVQGSGFARGVPRPLIVDESFARQLGVRSEELGVRSEELGVRSAGAAHKNMEAPQSIDSGNARKWHLVTSH